jgi:hypothetical protein
MHPRGFSELMNLGKVELRSADAKYFVADMHIFTGYTNKSKRKYKTKVRGISRGKIKKEKRLILKLETKCWHI